MIQQKLNRFRTQECQRKDVLDVTPREPVKAGQIEQAGCPALNNLVVSGACAGDGFGDRFPACSRLRPIVADD